MTLYGAIALLILVHSASRWRWAVLAVPVTVGLLVAASRLYEGVHYPTDVLGSVILSLAWLAVTRHVLLPRTKADNAASWGSAHGSAKNLAARVRSTGSASAFFFERAGRRLGGDTPRLRQRRRSAARVQRARQRTAISAPTRRSGRSAGSRAHQPEARLDESEHRVREQSDRDSGKHRLSPCLVRDLLERGVEPAALLRVVRQR